jgi:hypothetical protein
MEIERQKLVSARIRQSWRRPAVAEKLLVFATPWRVVAVGDHDAQDFVVELRTGHHRDGLPVPG